MGRDKALLPFRGGALVQEVARVAANAAGSAALVGEVSRYQGLGYPVIPDLYPGEGPLGGIIAALRHSSRLSSSGPSSIGWNLIVACDMPRLDAWTLGELLRLAAGADFDAVLPNSPEGRPQPLCAVYHGRCLPAFETVFAGGVRKVTAALANVRTLRWPVADASFFQNVNTPEEWEGVERSTHDAG